MSHAFSNGFSSSPGHPAAANLSGSWRSCDKMQCVHANDLTTLISAHRMNVVAGFIHNDPQFFRMIGDYKERMRAAKTLFNIKDMQGTHADLEKCARTWAAKQVGMSAAWKTQVAALAGAPPQESLKGDDLEEHLLRNRPESLQGMQPFSPTCPPVRLTPQDVHSAAM